MTLWDTQSLLLLPARSVTHDPDDCSTSRDAALLLTQGEALSAVSAGDSDMSWEQSLPEDDPGELLPIWAGTIYVLDLTSGQQFWATDPNSEELCDIVWTIHVGWTEEPAKAVRQLLQPVDDNAAAVTAIKQGIRHTGDLENRDALYRIRWLFAVLSWHDILVAHMKRQHDREITGTTIQDSLCALLRSIGYDIDDTERDVAKIAECAKRSDGCFGRLLKR